MATGNRKLGKRRSDAHYLVRIAANVLAITSKWAMLACVVLVAVVAVSPFNDAWGRGVRTNANTDQYQHYQEEFGAPVSFSAEASKPVQPDYSFEDEASGASLVHHPENASNSETNSEGFEGPYVEALVVVRGEECLHEEGSCNACDELRRMYHDGEVDALCRVAITPNPGEVGDERFSMSVPLDTNEKVTGYLIVRCDDESLAQEGSGLHGGNSGFTRVTLRGDTQTIQSPFGIVYNNSASGKTASTTTHAYVPDDDDDDNEEADFLTMLINAVKLIAFLVLWLVALYGVGLLISKVKDALDKVTIKWN